MHTATGSTNLADILERVLDRGVVIAGDITISLVEIELISIKLRLVIASVERAREIGINWWESDPALSTGARQREAENRALRDRIERLERLTGADSLAPDMLPDLEAPEANLQETLDEDLHERGRP